MALTALVIGTAAAVLGTGRVTVPLVLSTTVMWSWVPVVQLLTGWWMVAGRGSRRGEALSEYFATSRYWSVWLLGFTLCVLLAPRPFELLLWALATAVVPAALTARALVTLRQQYFSDSRSSAWRRVAIHQGITHGVIVLYFAWAVALWPRLIAMVRG